MQGAFLDIAQLKTDIFVDWPTIPFKIRGWAVSISIRELTLESLIQPLANALRKADFLYK
ncbi:hypothetical protein ACT6QH_04985 [Xanthobacter sp. TB0139]|uniref:hypothetical protein n=1 Tax=Xanthobacter sp. TB0139 TaxID=3459178 RepID=UPI0040396BDC